MLKEYTEEEITEGFEKALEEGKLTDVMGNPMTEEDLCSVDPQEEKDLTLSSVLDLLRSLQGGVLTVIDATFTDEKRLKFVKDLLKREFISAGDKAIDVAAISSNKSQSNPLK